MFEILTFQTTPYFAFGQQQKSSLIAQFCRQNRYQHIKNPILEAVNNKAVNDTIIEGSLQLFKALEPLRPQLQVVFVGTQFTEEQVQIRRDYRKIGKCIQVREFNYDKFRKSMFPNLIFFYGPNDQQNQNCAHALANQIGYCRVALPPNSNSFIKQFKKTVNYTVNGLFTSKEQLTILQQFFNIKVVHLQYNRIDLPEKSSYFDKQFELLSFLKSKNYYHPVNGLADDIKVIDDVSQAISPAMIYAQVDSVQGRRYLDEYVQRNEDKTIILSIFEIQSINKRKNIKLAETPFQRTNILNQILYRDFNINRAIILDFPFLLHQVVNFESANRKFESFVDLLHPSNVAYFKEYTTSMYFLLQQKRIRPDTRIPLESYIESKTKYWLVNGPSGSGKTTVSKYLSAQYGFKLIQYDPYFSSIKQKLLGPDGGEEVPFSKILEHFRLLLSQNSTQTYVIDGLPFDNKQLEQWIKKIGNPLVINLEVAQNQSIKRTRKKNQADVNAEINEEQLNKAKQSLAKSRNWLEKVKNLCPVAQIHEINFNSPLILSQKIINKIFKKNVYLIQNHNGIPFQNIALKYNLGFVNLNMPLRQSLKIVRNMSNKDVILCYYVQTQQNMISQDMYWIEKNIGSIRYLAVWQPEDLEAKQQKIHLEKPPVPQKVKVQGAEGQEKAVQQQAGDKKDNKFDIFAHEWTKPLNPKNLSQWFMKSKKNVKKVQSVNGKQLFQKWKLIANSLSESDDVAIYQTLN